ncbi:hypothetical protein [Prosthecobacter sp.]|uniref:hypothetical protein n=1 Tax=Prosthecobacter sp. TaxID=1965333 RepID=UPI0037843D89
MIRVLQTPAPENFELNCAQPGADWLRSPHNDNKDPHEQAAWWQAYKPHLAEAFHQRCGYLAMFITDGDVDHFLACGHRQGQPSPHRHRAFDWTNYRYADGATNVRKGTLDDQILDPFEIEEGWFEADLHSFQIICTELVPEALRNKAQKTITELCLNTDRRIRLLRRHFYECYWEDPTQKAFVRLEKDAPLIALAVKKRLQAGLPLPDPNLYPVPLDPVPDRQRTYAPRPRRARAP